MGITTRDLTPEDADAIAALMLRIEADHPTGFCLGAVEIGEIMRDKPDARLRGRLRRRRPGGLHDGDARARPRARARRFILFGDVDPRRLGEGLGTLMLGRSVDRARAIHAADAPGVPVAVRRRRARRSRRPGRPDAVGRLRAGTAQLPDGRRPPGRLPGPPLPAGVTVEPFDPADGRGAPRRPQRGVRRLPRRSPTISRDFWTMFMVTAAHARHALSVVARDADGSVAAYVFAHEYAVPPSGGAGPEIHVPYVGTLPATAAAGSPPRCCRACCT